MRKSLILLFCLCAASLSAHNPIFTDAPPTEPSTALRIKDPFLSQVYYRSVDDGRANSWFSFKAKKGDRITLSVGVPAIPRLMGMVPAAALIGPGLPEKNDAFPEAGEAGILRLGARELPEDFYEPITGTRSWIYIDEIATIPEDGEYLFVAYPSAKASENDKLWMVVGTKERFGLKELFSLGKIKKAVRAFHEIE